MPDRRDPPSLPPLPPLPEDEQITVEQTVRPPAPREESARERPEARERGERRARGRRPRSREAAAATTRPAGRDGQPPPRTPRPDEERRLWSAGHALVVCALALVISLVLNAPGAHKRAYNQPEGWEREVALAITGPLNAVAGVLLLDGPRRAIQAAIGRSGADDIDTVIALPGTEAPDDGGTATGSPSKPSAKPKPTVSKPTPTTPVKQAFTPKKKLRLWIAGDSLVITPGWSVVRATGASPVLESVGGVDGRVATGLTRPDVFNWFDEIRARVKELRPKVVVLAFGGNDDKAYMTGLPEGVSIGDFGDAAWRKEYGRRVGGVMDIVGRAGGHVIWIGLPQTSSPEQTQRFDVVNSVVAREARKREGRATFLDTYTTFASETGGYTQYLQTNVGNDVKVRADDGVHFERAGGDLLAREVLKVLNRTYDLTSWKRKQAAAS